MKKEITTKRQRNPNQVAKTYIKKSICDAKCRIFVYVEPFEQELVSIRKAYYMVNRSFVQMTYLGHSMSFP